MLGASSAAIPSVNKIYCTFTVYSHTRDDSDDVGGFGYDPPQWPPPGFFAGSGKKA